MAYTKRNKLNRIVDIQNLYQEKKLPGVTHAFVFREHIHPIYHISLRTLDEYLATPAVKLLKEMDETTKNKTAFIQTSMGFDESVGQDNSHVSSGA